MLVLKSAANVHPDINVKVGALALPTMTAATPLVALKSPVQEKFVLLPPKNEMVLPVRLKTPPCDQGPYTEMLVPAKVTVPVFTRPKRVNEVPFGIASVPELVMVPVVPELNVVPLTVMVPAFVTGPETQLPVAVREEPDGTVMAPHTVSVLISAVRLQPVANVREPPEPFDTSTEPTPVVALKSPEQLKVPMP